MLKNISQIALATLFATAFAGTALAQDGMEEPLDAAAPTAEEDAWSSENTTSAEPAASSSSDSSAAASGDDAGFYQMALSTAFPTGGDAGAANLLYGLDADTYLDLRVGINFNKTGDDPITMTEGASRFGVDLGVGYRMYKPSKGKIRPYLEPMLQLAVGDFSDFSPTMRLGVGALFGFDYALWEQFTLGASVGAGLTFSNEFEQIDFGLFTRNINATFWW